MKASATICISMAAAILLSASCKRRPLTDGDNNVLVNITIDKDIINYTVEEEPSLMRILFFDNLSGKYSTQAFTPSTGDYVSVIYGRTYHVLAYNFGTETTVIGSEDIHGEIFATTNEIPETYRTKLRSRSSENPDELIVFSPDHLFVGGVRDTYILARSSETPPVVIDIDASTVVESWILEVESINGMQWVADISGVITGLAQSTTLAQREGFRILRTIRSGCQRQTDSKIQHIRLHPRRNASNNARNYRHGRYWAQNRHRCFRPASGQQRTDTTGKARDKYRRAGQSGRRWRS